MSNFWHEYVEQYGWSIIPIQPKSKKPAISAWKEFQDRKPTADEIAVFSSRYPNHNVAVICGAVSGLVVLDVDSEDGYRFLKENGYAIPPTPRTQSSPGKGHFYFKHPGFPVKNMIRKVPGIDIKGDGGYVVAPPSIHPSGATYAWLEAFHPAKTPVAPCPQWLLDLIDQGREEAAPDHSNGKKSAPHSDDEVIDDTDWVVEYLRKGFAEGERNVAATKLAGHFLAMGNPHDRVMEMLILWDMRNDPPLGESELSHVVKSIWQRETAKKLRTEPHVRQDPNNLSTLDIDEQQQLFFGGFNERTGLLIEKFVKVMGENPQYIFTIEGVEVTLSSQCLVSQQRFKTKIMDAVNKIPQKVKTAEWDGLIANMLTVAEIVESGEEATVLGELNIQIIEYLAKNHNIIFNVDEVQDREMPDQDQPFIFRGELYINRNAFLKWLATYMMARPPSRNVVAQLFSRLGLTNIKLWIGKYQKQYRVWRVPQEFYLQATNQVKEGGDVDEQTTME